PPPTPSTQRPLTPPPPPLHDALPTWVRDPARAVDLLDTRLHVRVARDDDDLADGLGARGGCDRVEGDREGEPRAVGARELQARLDRKSTRLNSSHVKISYAVFCLKKK